MNQNDQARSNEDQQCIIDSLLAERQRQDEKWGEQNHWDTVWSLIFGEEYGEVQKEILERECSWGEAAEEHDAKLERELIQLVAVGIGWLEARARRRQRNNIPEAKQQREAANALFGDDVADVSEAGGLE